MVKYRKTTQAQYRQFQANCKRFQTELGLIRYVFYFDMKDLGHDSEGDRILGTIDVDQMGKCATVRLSDRYDSKFPDDLNPERIARHEIFHLLISRIAWLARSRYICNSDIKEEEESLVCTLENFMKKYKRRSQSHGSK